MMRKDKASELDSTRELVHESSLKKARGGMCRLWRTVLIERGVTADGYSRLMDKYIPKISIPGSSAKQQSQNRGNAVKDFRKETMTYKAFLKGLLFLGISSVTISVTLRSPDKEDTTHSVDIDV